MGHFSNLYLEPSWFESEAAASILTPEQLSVAQDTCEIMQSEYNFEDDFHDLIYWADSPMIRRIFFWLSNLNSARPYGNTAYPNLLKAIIWSFQTSKPIVVQTQYQCEISLYYLKAFLSYDVLVREVEDAKYLLLNIFMLSKRPDLCKRSVLMQMSSYSNTDFNNIFNSSKYRLLPYLFVDKQVPDFLFNHLLSLDSYEYDILIDLLDLKSIRKAVSNRYKISKFENNLLQTIEMNMFVGESNILERYLFIVKILKESPDDFLILKHSLYASKIFNDEWATFKNDLEFWISIYRILCRNKEYIRLHDISHFIDFFEAQRYYEAEPFKYSLKGRTFNSVNNAVEQWTLQINFTPEYLKYKWNPLPIDEWVTIKGNMSYIIYEITDGKRLREESVSLKHCVFSYAHSCYIGATHIFSLSKTRDNIKKPFVTIEVRDNKVTQIAAKANIEPKPELIELIKVWAKENSLGFNWEPIENF